MGVDEEDDGLAGEYNIKIKDKTIEKIKMIQRFMKKIWSNWNLL